MLRGETLFASLRPEKALQFPLSREGWTTAPHRRQDNLFSNRVFQRNGSRRLDFVNSKRKPNPLWQVWGERVASS